MGGEGNIGVQPTGVSVLTTLQSISQPHLLSVGDPVDLTDNILKKSHFTLKIVQ